MLGKKTTYGEHDVDEVHLAKNEVADACEVGGIGKCQEGEGDDVVGEHLPVVFPLLFQLKSHDGLGPECDLDEVVELGQRRCGSAMSLRTMRSSRTELTKSEMRVSFKKFVRRSKSKRTFVRRGEEDRLARAQLVQPKLWELDALGLPCQ